MPHYISRQELSDLINQAKASGPSPELCHVIRQIAEGIAKRYHYKGDREDFASQVLLNQLITLDKIDTSRNAFGYITTCAHHLMSGLVRSRAAEEKGLAKLYQDRQKRNEIRFHQRKKGLSG